MNPDLPDLIELPSGVSKPPAECSQNELEWAMEHRFANWLMLRRPDVRERYALDDDEALAQADLALREAKAISAFSGLEMPTVIKPDFE